MFKYFKNLLGFTNNQNTYNSNSSLTPKNAVINYSDTSELDVQHIKPHTKPTCSFCKCPEHNITKCPEVLEEIGKIKAYCSEYANQQNIPGTTKWLEQFDEKILNRYVVSSNINNYMWSHCTVYYSNNIEGTKGKKRLIELIIGHDCVLPLHPEIKIKREYKKKQPVTNTHCHHNSNPNNFSVGAFGTGIVIGTGVATGFAMANMLD